MKDYFLALLSLFGAVIIVILFLVLAWYLLWVLILSKFKFIKDLWNSTKRARDGAPQSDQLKTSRLKTKKTRKD